MRLSIFYSVGNRTSIRLAELLCLTSDQGFAPPDDAPGGARECGAATLDDA